MKMALIRCGKQMQLVSQNKKTAISLENARNIILRCDTFVSTSERIDESLIDDNGEMLISLSDDNKLIIYNTAFFCELMHEYEFPYYTAEEYAQKHNRNSTLVRKLCREGRLSGAIQVGSSWLIPKDTLYPRDGRAGRDMSKRYANKHTTDSIG